MSDVSFKSLNICDITTSSRMEKCFVDFFKNNTTKHKFSFEDELWKDFCIVWNNNFKTIKIEEYMKRLHRYREENNLESLIHYLSIYEGIGEEFQKNPIRIKGNILNNGNHRILIIRFLMDNFNHNKLMYIVSDPYLSSLDAKKLIESININNITKPWRETS